MGKNTEILKYTNIVAFLSWEELKQRYRRSKLGPNWITISLAVQVAAMGYIFSSVFKIGAKEYLVHISIGMVLWAFISSSIQTSCNSLIASGHLIKQMPFPIWGHILRNQIREIYVVGHNLILLPLIYVLVVKINFTNILIAIIGFIFVAVNMFCISIILSMLTARYRDIAQMISSLLQVIFYATPIMWKPEMLDESIAGILAYNPFYYYIEVVRGALLNQDVGFEIYSRLLGVTTFCVISAFSVYRKNEKKIAYWV